MREQTNKESVLSLLHDVKRALPAISAFFFPVVGEVWRSSKDNHFLSRWLQLPLYMLILQDMLFTSCHGPHLYFLITRMYNLKKENAQNPPASAAVCGANYSRWFHELFMLLSLTYQCLNILQVEHWEALVKISTLISFCCELKTY